MSDKKYVVLYRADGSSIDLVIDDDEAISLLNKLRDVFGWSGTEFQRVDVEDRIGRPLTDEEWDKVQNNYFWESGIPEQACQGGWYAIDNLISDLNLVGKKGAE